MGQTSTSMKSSQSQDEKPDHEHDLSTRASQVRFTTADMTDSMRSPARHLRTSHTPQARGKVARLRPTDGRTDKRTKDQGERLAPKVPRQIETQDARSTSDMCSMLSQSMDISHSPGSSSPGSSSPGSSSLTSSQIGNPSTRQKKKNRKKKKVPVTDPNHGKESSQTITKVKSPAPVASTTFHTQEWASIISQKVNIEDSILGTRTSPSTVHPRQEQEGTPSNRVEKLASIPQEIQTVEDSASVSSQPASNNATSNLQLPTQGQEAKLPLHEITSPTNPSQISQIEPGQRFPEYTSSDSLETHTQPWDDIHDFSLSYYDDPSPPELPSRISVGPHVTFRNNNYSYQLQQSEGLSGIHTLSTSSTVSTVRLSPASSLNSHTLEGQLVGIPEHVTLDQFGGDQGSSLPDVPPSIAVDKKAQGLSRQMKPLQNVVASSQGSDPMAKAPSQSLRSSNTSTTAPTLRPSTVNESKTNDTLSPTQSSANRIPSTQSPAKCGSESARDHASDEWDIEPNSEEISEIPHTSSTRKGPKARQRRVISSDDSESEAGNDKMHSPGTTRPTTRITSMTPRKSRPSTTADATSGQGSEMSDSSPKTPKSPSSDLSLLMHTPLKSLQQWNEESESSGFRPNGSESDENTPPKQHNPRTTNTQPPKRRTLRQSENDSDNSISDSDHTRDGNSSIMNANQHNDGCYADKSRHLRKSKEARRYVFESVAIPSSVKRTGEGAPSTLPGRLSPTLSNQQTRTALRGRYLLEAVVIPAYKVVKRFRSPPELQKPQGKQDKEEPPRKRTKPTVDSSVPFEHEVSESTEQVVEISESDTDIDDNPERLFWNPEEKPLAETPHHGHPSLDLSDMIPELSANHEGSEQEQAASKEGENSEDGEEGRRLIVDGPDWTDLIELWKKHDFQWALQKDRKQASRVQPYSSDFVFGTAVLDTQ
ncbi:hypothetical protein MVEG_00584 [Podila verticillata NRRL 6337]|nr:hypothetical protein MVEG_00584 [Podila verticillata NRRL 6337]